MLKESLSMFKRRLKGIKAIKRYKGSPEQICRQILAECYNGIYFQVSAGHFSNFYIRDFGICVESLLSLGYKKEVINTLSYALSCYEKNGRITTTIKSNGVCKDFFSIGPDSLAFLLYSLRISKIKELVSAYKAFLEKEITRYHETIVDKNTGLAKKGYFSSMKDHAIRNSSCYDNCMLAVISREADLLRLKNPFRKYNYKDMIYSHFWNKEKKYFMDDLDNDVPTGDANVFPYWCRIFDGKKVGNKNVNEKEMLDESIKAIHKNKLDSPFPLKYWNTKRYGHFLGFPSFFAPHYETDAVWTHLGLCYLDVLAKIDKKLLSKHIQMYTKLIETNKNFIELYDEKGSLYSSLFYLSDESMIWCCKYLMLRKIK